MSHGIIFSVIIPHKNTPNLLWRCLNSIPRRKDFQIIVVDDNSSIENIKILENLLNLYSHVEFIFGKNENGRKGAGYARNLGLEKAKGKWLLFADADDFFTENAFDILFQYADNGEDIIYFKIDRCYSDTLEPVENGTIVNKLIDDFINKTDDCENQIRYRHIVGWGKMIKRNLVTTNQIYFDEVRASNDIMFSIKNGHYAESVTVVNKLIYCYTLNRGSLSNTLSLDVLTAKYIIALCYNEFLTKHNQKRYRWAIVMFYILSSIKYGLKTFFYFVKLAIQYRANPFIGMDRWLNRYFNRRKRLKQNSKYIISEK